MGFFKELKEDLSQAVNELLPEDESVKEAGEAQEEIVNTLDTSETAPDISADNEKMKEWLEEFAQKDDEEQAAYEEEASAFEEETTEQRIVGENTAEIKEEEENTMDDNIDLELLEAMNSEEETAKEEEEKPAPKLRATAIADDEVTVISKGTTITGNISSDGSLDMMGTLTGDIECLGKLSITGKIVGNSSAAEVYVNTERLEGSITSEGSVKVGLGTVIIGDIIATSGVIAGAVKGEIDINGPIVVDSTAIIKGNIKAKSVQINNGAVIEGFCSLSYSSVDVDNIFE
jgi:cytoskeletal protein CcmA (bactofilin family)